MPCRFWEGRKSNNESAEAKMSIISDIVDILSHMITNGKAITDNPYAYYDKDYATVFVLCGEGVNPYPVMAQKAAGGLWYLGNLSLLECVIQPQA